MSSVDETTLRLLVEAFDDASTLDGSVNDRLARYAELLRLHHREFAEGVDRLVARLQAAHAGMTAPNVGEPMPSFLLPDDGGQLVSLESLISEGPVALAFHRGHWCPYCRINAACLAAAHMEIQRLGGDIVAITPERQRFTRQHKLEAGAQFRILSDIGNGFALSLGLAIWVGEEVKSLMAGVGRELPLYQGNDAWFLPIPATFVVGRDGLIKARFVDPDYRRRMDIDDLLAAIRAAQDG